MGFPIGMSLLKTSRREKNKDPVLKPFLQKKPEGLCLFMLSGAQLSFSRDNLLTSTVLASCYGDIIVLR